MENIEYYSQWDSIRAISKTANLEPIYDKNGKEIKIKYFSEDYEEHFTPYEPEELDGDPEVLIQMIDNDEGIYTIETNLCERFPEIFGHCKAEIDVDGRKETILNNNDSFIKIYLKAIGILNGYESYTSRDDGVEIRFHKRDEYVGFIDRFNNVLHEFFSSDDEIHSQLSERYVFSK